MQHAAPASAARLCLSPLTLFNPRVTCLRTAGAAFFWASVALCLRPSCRSRGVMGRGKQLVAFLDYGGKDN
jgi:hypothetical protein